MNSAQRLHELGQRLWLDNLSRELLENGTLARYIRELSLTGLTSNPTIFDKAMRQGALYDQTIRRAPADRSDEAVFFDLAIEDLRRAAALFRPAFEASDGADGWVSLEVSPLLADDTEGTIAQATRLHAQASIPNLFIKIPGTPAGIPAIEECIVTGMPVNVTLLFSTAQYLAAAEAYRRAMERRFVAGLTEPVRSVASLFVSRWDKAVADRAPAHLRNKLGIAVAQRTYAAYRELLDSPSWRGLFDKGATAQRLLFASTGTKDPSAPDVLYVEALIAPDTINTMPDATLLAFAQHGAIKATLATNADEADAMLAAFAKAGVDAAALAEKLQRDGARSFAESWNDLMSCVAAKRGAKTGRAA